MTKKTKMILGSAVALLLIVISGVLYYASTKVNGEEIRKIVLENLEKSFPNASVKMGKLDVSMGTSIKLKSDKLEITYSKENPKHEMLSVSLLEVRIPILAILTGGGDVDITLSAPRIGYFEIGKENNWSLAAKQNSKQKQVEEVPPVGKQKETPKSSDPKKMLLIPPFLANSGINIRLNNLNVKYLLKNKESGVVVLNKFVVKQLSLNKPSAIEVDSKIDLNMKNDSLALNLFVLGQFDLKEFIDQGKVYSKILVKLDNLKLKNSGLKIPNLKNDIVLHYHKNGKINGNVEIGFEKSNLNFSYLIIDDVVSIKDINSKISVVDLKNMLEPNSSEMLGNSGSIALKGKIEINKGKISPKVEILNEGDIIVKSQGFNVANTFNLSMNQTAIDLSMSSKVLDGVVKNKVNLNFDLNSTKDIQERIRNLVVDSEVQKINLSKGLIQGLLYSQKSSGNNSSKNEGDAKEESSSTKTNNKTVKTPPIALPTMKAYFTIKDSLLGSEKLNLTSDILISNNAVNIKDAILKIGSGQLKTGLKAQLGNNGTALKIDTVIKNVDAASFDAFLPPNIGEMKGIFNGKINGDVFVSDKSIKHAINVEISGLNGEVNKINIKENVKGIYGMLEKISFLKGKVPNKDININGAFENINVKARFDENVYHINNFEFIGDKKKVVMKGKGKIYPEIVKQSGELFVDFEDEFGLSKALEKQASTRVLPLRLTGVGFSLMPDYEYTVKKIGKKAAKKQGKKAIKKVLDKQLDKLGKDILKDENNKKKIKSLLKGLF